MKKTYNMDITEILGNNKRRYMQVVRVLALIEGVNQSITLAIKMESSLEEKQYRYLKKQYTEDLLALLKNYDLSLRV